MVLNSLPRSGRPPPRPWGDRSGSSSWPSAGIPATPGSSGSTMTRQSHGTLLAKDEGSSFYLAPEGLGGYNLPPDHPNRFQCIREVRGGHEIAAFAISNVS